MAVEVLGLKAALNDFASVDGIVVNAVSDAARLADAVRAGAGPLVLVSDGVDRPSLEVVAAAVRESGRPCIEVRSERWDGESPSLLSAACRGVVSGFGIAAVRLAAAVLASP